MISRCAAREFRDRLFDKRRWIIPAHIWVSQTGMQGQYSEILKLPGVFSCKKEPSEPEPYISGRDLGDETDKPE